MNRIALIGAGNIARVHAEALRTLPGALIAAIIDPAADRAAALARDFGAPRTFASLDAALADDAFDRAHVLVPPDRHAEIGRTLIAAGKPALLEKPLAHSGEACRALETQARAASVTLGVNQNFVHHPAFVQLQSAIRAGQLGRPDHISCIYTVPLRQLIARQFGHWMFASPVNLLLEQAVHPLSQIAALAGPIGEVDLLAGPAFEMSSDRAVYPSLDALLQCADLNATLRFAVGRSFPFWQITVVGDDGVGVADILGNRYYAHRRTRWLETADNLVSGARTAAALSSAGLANASGYALSMVRLKPRSDPFYLSMGGSIAAFHRALDANERPALDASFGAMLVEACERIAARLPARPAGTPAPRPESTHTTPDVAILGGTGFIGAHLVRQCLDKGLTVAVMARSTNALPDLYRDPRVRVQRGDIGDADAVARAMAGAPAVVNLAHGGGGATRAAIEAAMVGGAETVARACLAAGVRRLVHVGSIAALYLGPDAGTIAGATPPDPFPDRRGDYAAAKVAADRLLLRMHKEDGLRVVILRPGVVVGEGASPFHSGLGLFNNEQHCIGWNEGRNPLPFVLAEDVADAILRACSAPGIDGRCYNLVGDVRPTARDYIADLAAALHRPLRFHPQKPSRLYATDFAKWGIKRAGGRRTPLPSMRDTISRGMRAGFDCSDAKRDLGWSPVADPTVFKARAIEVHAR